MTTTSWIPALKSAAIPASCVRIEIKPHNPSGINAGIKQLRSRRWGRTPNVACAGGKPQHFLITYELQAPPSTTATIRIAPIRVTGTKVPPTFSILGNLSVPNLNSMMPKRNCDTIRGSIMEDAIRTNYAAEMKARFGAPLAIAPKTSTSAKGPDIDHEFAEFLAELAGELADR